MSASIQFSAGGVYDLRLLAEDGERIFCEGWREDAGARTRVLGVLSATPLGLDRLAHEYALRDDLSEAWAARPIILARERDQSLLVLEDPGGRPLDLTPGAPMEVGGFLRLGIAIAQALGNLHRAGLVHKDLKPAHILVGPTGDAVWLTGFGIASRSPRERQPPRPPEVIEGTLAYMAPEQTGRMNRSVDSRSDLYALGVTFYQALTGALPFSAADPMEWIHCHIARQATPPSERVKTIPSPLSAIVMKLLAKTADERYQTAAGVVADLRHCQAEWEAGGRIEPFALGARDVSDRLIIPEKLYGREPEIDLLLAAFDRVVEGGPAELVLVSGYSGIGKSAVVSELYKALVPPRGLFASGKFDQHKRDIPYSTLVQAFQSLVRPILVKGDAELAIWRDAFLTALAPNARLLTDLIPELKLIIGEPPPVPELDPRQAQSRFQLLFRRFIGVFARREHPLALFFDDLQWLDAASLDLIEDLLSGGSSTSDVDWRLPRQRGRRHASADAQAQLDPPSRSARTGDPPDGACSRRSRAVDRGCVTLRVRARRALGGVGAREDRRQSFFHDPVPDRDGGEWVARVRCRCGRMDVGPASKSTIKVLPTT